MVEKQNDPNSFPMHLSREVERLFDEMIHRPWGFCRDVRGWNPSVDLSKTKDAFIVEADLPGVKSEDVKVKIQNGDFVLPGWRASPASRPKTAAMRATLISGWASGSKKWRWGSVNSSDRVGRE